MVYKSNFDYEKTEETIGTGQVTLCSWGPIKSKTMLLDFGIKGLPKTKIQLSPQGKLKVVSPSLPEIFEASEKLRRILIPLEEPLILTLERLVPPHKVQLQMTLNLHDSVLALSSLTPKMMATFQNLGDDKLDVLSKQLLNICSRPLKQAIPYNPLKDALGRASKNVMWHMVMSDADALVSLMLAPIKPLFCYRSLRDRLLAVEWPAQLGWFGELLIAFNKAEDEGVQLEAVFNQIEGKLRENIKMVSVLYVKNCLAFSNT
jgi:hypothetical protein